MFSFFYKNKLDTKQSVDIIEKIAYDKLKPLGFKKYGRTLHRFVDGDISQVINFQSGIPSQGMSGLLCVNIGIRIPECKEWQFDCSDKMKKYYHEYECNLRTRIGWIGCRKDKWYDLKKSPEKIGAEILNKIQKYVLPMFDALNSREAVIFKLKNYLSFFEIDEKKVMFDTAMIYHRKGDIKKASDLFNEYYRCTVEEYFDSVENGEKIYLKKGETIMCRDQKITAEKSGVYTIYNANDGYIKTLKELANKLNINIQLSEDI